LDIVSGSPRLVDGIVPQAALGRLGVTASGAGLIQRVVPQGALGVLGLPRNGELDRAIPLLEVLDLLAAVDVGGHLLRDEERRVAVARVGPHVSGHARHPAGVAHAHHPHHA